MLGYLTMGMFQTILAACVLTWLFAAPAAAASLRGYPGAQLIQNERADADRLSRLEDRTMLQRFARLQLIDPIPGKTRNYYLHSVPAQYRYLRPWAKLFLDRLSSQYRARFRKPLRVTSLTRTAAYQKSLRRKNSNAAAANGAKRSTHLTGASLDISKKGMRRAEVRWMRRVLSSLKAKGYLFPVEEFQQPNFHVMVFRNYPQYVEKLLARRSRR